MKAFCGIDVGTRSSAICVMNDGGRTIVQWQGKTSQLVAVIHAALQREGEIESMLCVLESGPLAESLCKKLEKQTLVTANIVDGRRTKALMNAKKKTDRIDAEKLAEIARLGYYQPVHRKSGKARISRTELGGRAAIVRSATALKNCIRGLCKAHGVVLPSGGTGRVFIANVRAALAEHRDLREIQTTITALLLSWAQLHRTAERLYQRLKTAAANAQLHPEAQLLMSVPGVGAATALAFATTVGDYARFKTPEQVASYFGLAPRVHQSGPIEFHGRITKQGDALVRTLLIEAAHSILTRSKVEWSVKQWGLELLERRGAAKARVAVARRLCGILFKILRSKRAFDPAIGRQRVALPLAA